ncbi:hypothetical protein HKX48_008324 [Thoreauomyces humboldtii]|nr:hypothetical protein HKX48_008324 [Thoreauomyces humboldtii]
MISSVIAASSSVRGRAVHVRVTRGRSAALQLRHFKPFRPLEVTQPGIVEAVVQDHKNIAECYKVSEGGKRSTAGHRGVFIQTLFTPAQNYKDKAGDPIEQAKWGNQLIWEVARHSVAEEIVVYPSLRLLPNGHHVHHQALVQHQQIKDDLHILDRMSKLDATYPNQLAKVMRDLDHHFKEEERVELPKLADHLSKEESGRMRKEFERMKRLVPTRPHPSAPDKPPFETVAGLLAAPLDKIKDMFRSFPKKE